jgi:hypothetical protein
MPYAKVLQIKSAKGLSGKLAYLTSSAHRNHRDKIISAPTYHRVQTTAEFQSKTVSTMRDLKARQRRGRPIKNIADEVIIRLPDWSNPTDDERAQFLQNIIAEFCPDSPAIGVWHLDKYNGSADLHLVVGNYIETFFPPKVRRSSAFNPISLVRSASDQITDLMNVRRQRQGVAPITTMREVRKERLKARGLKSLAEQLAALPPFPAADLSKKIASLGHKVTRFNPKANSISVCLADGKKAHRFFVDRLLQEAADLGVNLAAKIVPPPVPKLPRPTPRPGASEVGFE